MSCTAVVVGAYLEYFATIHGGGSGIRDTKTTKMEAARHMETGAPSHSKICFMDCQTNRNISTHWSTQSQVTSTAELFVREKILETALIPTMSDRRSAK